MKSKEITRQYGLMGINKNERKVRDRLAKQGRIILRLGWPDFLIADECEGTIFAVEVKVPPDKLSEDQKQMHTVLEWAGIPVFTVNIDENSLRTLTEIKGQRVIPDKLRTLLDTDLNHLIKRYVLDNLYK